MNRVIIEDDGKPVTKIYSVYIGDKAKWKVRILGEGKITKADFLFSRHVTIGEYNISSHDDNSKPNRSKKVERLLSKDT